MPTFRINNRQSSVAQSTRAIFKPALIVRSAMTETIEHVLNSVVIPLAPYPSYSTHDQGTTFELASDGSPNSLGQNEIPGGVDIERPSGKAVGQGV